jgi:flagellar biosynthesis protein FlhB
MAENAAERTEQPTPKRLDEARKKGQIPRSTELNAAAVILAVGAGLHYLGGYMGTRLNGLMSSSLSLTREQSVDESLMISTLTTEAAHALIACAPILGLTLLVALLAPMLLGGWNMSFEALTPDFTRLNPLNGFGRMFSMNSAVNLAKAFAKFIFLGLVAVLVLKQKYSELMGLGMEPIRVAIGHATSLTGYAFLMLAATLGLIAAIDVPWQLFQHNKQLRMTREEIKEEMKESDGSPEVKGRVRQLQREFSRRRMMQDVPKADVIVTNPTHFAVALKYDEKRMGGRSPHPRGCHREPRPYFRSSAAGACLVQECGDRCRDSGHPVRGRGPGSHLHLSTEDCAPRRCAAAHPAGYRSDARRDEALTHGRNRNQLNACHADPEGHPS